MNFGLLRSVSVGDGDGLAVDDENEGESLGKRGSLVTLVTWGISESGLIATNLDSVSGLL